MTTNHVLIAPCGMNCALCAGYLALKHDLRVKGIRMIQCVGCRPRNKKCAFLKKQCSKLSRGSHLLLRVQKLSMQQTENH